MLMWNFKLTAYGGRLNFSGLTLHRFPAWCDARPSQTMHTLTFTPKLSCLSAVLRQFMVFDTDLHRFVAQLKYKLGPQLILLPLLYHGAPELKDILATHDIHIQARPEESLDTSELRTRFQTLMVSILSIIAEIRLFALFLDDLQEADD